VKFEFSVLSVVRYLGLLLGVSNVVGVVCDCMTVDVVDSCMHLKWRSTYLWFFQVAGLVWSWGLCVRFAGCWFTGSVLWRVWCGWLRASWKRGFGSFRDCSGISLPAWWRDWMWSCLHFYSTKYHTQQPLYNILELLMMGMVMPETCWASNKICIKNLCCI